MNELDVIEKVLDLKSQNTNFSIALLVFVFINIAVTVISIYGKSKEKKIEGRNSRLNLREEKRIKVFEELYSRINELSLLDPYSTDEFSTKIYELDKLVRENGLYINRALLKISTSASDYFKELYLHPEHKNYDKEEGFMKSIKEEFNK